jgi:hypothetical protein
MHFSVSTDTSLLVPSYSPSYHFFCVIPLFKKFAFNFQMTILPNPPFYATTRINVQTDEPDELALSKGTIVTGK